jgi:hypothetical protein
MSASVLARTFVIAALFGVGLAGAAFARDQVVTAKLVQPVAQSTQVIADQALWRCEGDTCRAMVRHDPTVRACRQLVRETGAVASYGPEDAKFSTDEIERCNAYAPNAQQARN